MPESQTCQPVAAILRSLYRSISQAPPFKKVTANANQS